MRAVPTPRCPACKIILDGGRLAAAARWLALVVGAESPLYAAAFFLADTVAANTEAIIHGIKSGALNSEQIDEAHAWSELQCHRAAHLRDRSQLIESVTTPELLAKWAEEDRLHATALAGGEYDGAWIVEDVRGIRQK